MLDMKFLRENVDSVKENMKKKFQEHKLELVDKVVEMDKVNRQLKQRGDDPVSYTHLMLLWASC